jgi:hypothetical protein
MQAELVREILGYPLHQVAVDPAWLYHDDRAVITMAQQIYDYRSFERMPLLAWAFEDAGCACEAIIRHCRQRGRHVRGCWLLDLVLGKE